VDVVAQVHVHLGRIGHVDVVAGNGNAAALAEFQAAIGTRQVDVPDFIARHAVLYRQAHARTTGRGIRRLDQGTVVAGIDGDRVGRILPVVGGEERPFGLVVTEPLRGPRRPFALVDVLDPIH